MTAPYAAEMVALAARHWGPQNKVRSTRKDARFGTNGSKSVNLDDATWYDHEANTGGGYRELYKLVHGAFPKNGNGNSGKFNIVAEYDYRDHTGALLFQVVRLSPKNFVQRRPDGNGGWIWKTADITKVLYRLPELLAAPQATVFIPEGEKDVEALRQRLLVATCNPGGAEAAGGSKWLPAMSDSLRDRDVVIVPDNDETGEKHAANIASSLKGKARSVRVVRLPGLPPKGDVSDWLAAGGTAEELERLAREVPEQQDRETKQIETDYECNLGALKGKEFKPIMWIVPDFIPEGLTVFAGKPKIGKSWLMLGVALGVSRGKEALGKFAEQGDVLYLGLEDGERRMHSRVTKILGDAIKEWPENFTFRWRLDALDEGGLDYIEKWLADHPNRRLVVIDVLAKVRGRKARDEEQYQYDYRMLSGLQGLATRYRVAIVVVHHVRKSDANDVLDTVSGTTGIAGAADNVMVLGVTPKGARLYIRGRDNEEQDKLVEFDPETAVWEVVGDFDETDPGGGLQGLRKKVSDLLAAAISPLTPAQITEKLNEPGTPRNNIKQVLWRMLKSQPPQVAKSAVIFGAYEIVRPREGS
jgi:hypothetical protein